MQHRRRAAAVLLVLAMLLPMLTGFKLPSASGRLYACHAAFARRSIGTRLGFSTKNCMWMYIKNIGSDGGSRKNNKVTFRPVLCEDDIYVLEIYYMTGSNDRYFDLEVNGVAARVDCPGDPDENWDKVMVVRTEVSLRKGCNTLRFGNEDWFAPSLERIAITKGEEPEMLPITDKNTPDPVEFSAGTLKLTLDKANGTYDIMQGGRVLLRSAFCAAELEGKRVYAQEYDSHAVSEAEGCITFLHKKAGLPALEQTFRLEDGYVLTDVAAISDSEIAANWIAPVYTGDSESLGGGTQFLQVPYDNDDYVSFERAGVNSVGSSHEMTALINDADNSAVVIGSVSHDTWKTGIDWRGVGGRVTRFCVYGGIADKLTRDTQPHGTVTGQRVASPAVFIGAYADWRMGLNAYGKANTDVAAPLPWSGGPIKGWNSWGVVQDGLTDEIAFAVSDYFKAELQPVWQEDENDPVYINLDAWWNEAFGRKLEPHAIDLWDGEKWISGGLQKKGLRAFVEYCQANGQKAGAYHTPFACWEWQIDGSTGMVTDSMGNQHKATDILLTDKDGNLLPSWDRAYAFDLTHPAVIAWIEYDIQLFLDAGISYLKMDFMSHGAMEGVRYDKSVQTGTQAYNQAMQRIAEQVDGKMFLNLSIAPIFPYQYTHGRRMACDTFYDIGGTKYMLNSLTFGFWQRELYACPDPDHIVLWGKEGKAEETEARARATSGLITASFLAGDDFSKIDPAAKARYDMLLKNADAMALAHSGTVFEPMHLPDIANSTAAELYFMQDGGTQYYAVFNFSGSAKKFTLNLAGAAEVKELWSGQTAQPSENFTVELAGKDARIYRVK